jgi:peptide subunit release factor 1 (eRF1)
MHHPSKYEKNEFCRFLKNVKVSSSYSTDVSRLILLPNLKVAPGVKSHDYHAMLTQMIIVEIQNILSINVQEAIMNFFFLFNVIGQKVLNEEALESLEKTL